MKKRTAGVVPSARPNWQRNVLSKAIAMAGASLQASTGLAACPTDPVTAAQVTVCTVGAGETATITNTGSITASPIAIAVTGSDSQAVVNDGTLSGQFAGIIDVGSGTVTITNNASGVISAQTTGIFITSSADLVLTNAGTISVGGSSTSSAGGIYMSGSLNGSITNSGEISAMSVGTSEGLSYAWAGGIWLSGDLAGSVDNSGSITADASGSNTSVSATGIHVDSNLSGSLTNTGSIAASATGTGAVNVIAAGIVVSHDVTGSITNSGTVSGSAAGSSFASAAGIYIGAPTSGATLAGSIDNTGTISASADAGFGFGRAGGVVLYGDMTADASITGGEIDVSAGGDGAEGAGIVVFGLVNGGIDSNGPMTVSVSAASSSGTAYGVFASAVGTDGSITNSGTMTVGASGSDWAGAFGIDTFSVFDTGQVTNSGTMSVTASGTSAHATGISVGYLFGTSASVANSGTMTVEAHGSGWANATGVFVYSMGEGGSITNDGTITVLATEPSGTSAFGWAYAYGILAPFVGSGSSVTNSGTIDVTATGGYDGGEGVGIYVASLYNGSTVDNSGTINVMSDGAIAGESGTLNAVGAIGIEIGNMNGGATLTNSGTINANTSAGTGTGWALVVSNGTSTAETGFPVISNTGTMRGNILLNNASLNNSGLLSIPVSSGASGTYSTINNGNYTQMTGGVLEIGALSNTMYGRLVVNGTADFLASGHLAVNVSPNDLLNPTDVLDNVVSATTLNSGGDSNLFVTDNSPFWQFTATDDGEGGIDLMVSGQPRGFLTAAGAQVMNVNLDALQGEVMGRMDVTRLIRREGGHAQNLWFRPYGSWASLDDSGSNSVGYDNDTYGMVIGYDTYMNGSDWNFGGAFSYAKSNVDGKSSLNKDKIETDLYSGSIYAYGNLDPDTFVDLLAIGGWGSNDTRRNLGINGTATGDYDSWYARLSAAIGRNYQMNQQWTFTPKGSVIYTYVNEDSYKEKGPTGLALDVDSTDADSLIFMLDAILSYQINPGALLTAHAGGGYDALADDLNVDATFIGGTTTFKTKANGPDDWLAVAGVGAEFEASDTVEIHFNYDYEYRNDFTNNQVVATLRWKL